MRQPTQIITMTTNPNTPYPKEYSMNTTPVTFLRYGNVHEVATSGTQPQLMTAVDAAPVKRSTNGKIPRTTLSAKRERGDVEYRSRMQEARVLLSQELYGQEVNNFASLRLARGYSQAQLAQAIGSTQPYIAKIEGGFSNILLSTAKHLSSALGVDLNQISAILESSAENAKYAKK